MSIPDFIMIGAMKCATTTLHHQLASQPGIFMTDKNDEPDYFSDDERYARGWQWYTSLFSTARRDDLLGDASTGYAKLPTYPRTVERMYRCAPDARLIYVMRHPVDRLVSHYIHDWSMGFVFRSIDSAVASHPSLVDYGCYAMQLRPYLESFGRDRVLPVFFERLVACPQAELRRITRFIHYPGEPVWMDGAAKTNASKDRLRRSPWRDRVVDASLLRTIRRRLVPKRVRNQVRRFWTITERPELSPEVSRRVTARFDDDLAELGDWLGVPMNCETFKSVTAMPDLDWVDRRPQTAAAAG